MTIIDAVNNFGDNSQEGASAGPMALAVIAILAVATILLWRNMTARIKRLPASFPDQAGHPADRKAAAGGGKPSAGTPEKSAGGLAASSGSAEPTAGSTTPETPVEPTGGSARA